MTVLVTRPDRIEDAIATLTEELALFDAACSRFRADSELSRVNAARGRRCVVGELLAAALAVALRVARVTGGDVDPTVGSSLIALGYDRDFTAVGRGDQAAAVTVLRPAGWRQIRFDLAQRVVQLPVGVSLDLGATAKALAADRIARRAARACGSGVLVSLGGDISVSGEPPAGGWSVRVTDDHRAEVAASGQTVSISNGGLATSSTTVRSWHRGGRKLGHIIDPATGNVPAPYWRTVSVTAASCVDANAAATAAIVRGERATGWLASLGLPARLVRTDGSLAHVAGWPPPPPAPTSPAEIGARA